MGVSRWIILWLSDWTGLKHLKKPLPARKREAKWILCLLYHIMLCWYYRGGDTCKCSIKSGHTRMSQRSQHVGQQDNVTFYFLFIADMFDKGCSSVQHCFILHSTRKKEKENLRWIPTRNVLATIPVWQNILPQRHSIQFVQPQIATYVISLEVATSQYYR